MKKLLFLLLIGISSISLNAQITSADFKQLIEGIELKKGVTMQNAEWLINKGFTRTKKFREYYDTYLEERYELIEDGGISIIFQIYDSGRIDIKIHYNKDHNKLYESTKSKIASHKKIGIFEHCNWYDILSQEYQMGDYYFNFIRGIVHTELNGGYKFGSICISNYSQYLKCK